MKTVTTTKDNGLISGARETVVTLAETGIDIAVLKKKLTNAVDEAMLDTNRMAKHARRVIEDAIDDTAHAIKKDPLRSVGYAAGAGLGLGLIAGWLITRRSGR